MFRLKYLDLELDMFITKEFGECKSTEIYNYRKTIMNRIMNDEEVQGMLDLAVLYEYGYPEGDIPKDYVKSMYWYFMAASFGSAKGAYYYGRNYLVANSGQGSLADVEKRGMEYIKFAADNGFPQAQHMLGVAYSNGWGVEVSSEDARKYLSLAIQNGIEEAKQDIEML